MEPKIVNRAPFDLVGLQIRTKSMSPEIPALWPMFARRIPELRHVAEPGVTWGWMKTPPDAPDALLYLAAVPVTSTADVPEDMTATRVPAGTVAVFEFPFSQIGAAFGFIFREWLPRSGHVQADGPLLERYGADFRPDQPGSPMQIHLPVRQRA